MFDLPDDRDQRTDAVAEHIHRVTAAVLPDPQEQREAEVKALVISVDKEPAQEGISRYQQERESFTGTTHFMRVLMARQLEPKFREYLRDESPRLAQDSNQSREQKNADLAKRKALFSEEVTTGLFRLGLALFWEKGEKIAGPCYLSADDSTTNTRGRYLIQECGSAGHFDQLNDWHRKNQGPEDIEQRLRRATLGDAAAPGKPNRLSPSRSR